MTFYVQESSLTINFAVNQPNLSGSLKFVVTSQYSKQPLNLTAVVQNSNDRYTMLQTTFPTGFGDEHKNGVYYWSLVGAGDVTIEEGLVKIITEPGGGMGTVAYNSGEATEQREADVYYRPNY